MFPFVSLPKSGYEKLNKFNFPINIITRDRRKRLNDGVYSTRKKQDK